MLLYKQLISYTFYILQFIVVWGSLAGPVDIQALSIYFYQARPAWPKPALPTGCPACANL